VARWVVKETEESAQEETDRHSETKTDTHSDDVDENGQRWTIESRKKRADILRGGAPSPCLAEFEEFLDNELVGRQQNKDKAPGPKGKQSKNDYWEGILQSEKTRIEALNTAALVPLEDIMDWTNSDTANVPIVNTLSPQRTDLPTIATLAVKSARVPQNILSDASSSDDEVPIVSTLRAAKAKGQIKKQKAPLWVYETVKEPTGVASKYWDAEPPSERATKRLAKLKLSLVNATNDEHSGINMPLALANNVFLLKIFVMSIPF
jgi:hypothetical protein